MELYYMQTSKLSKWLSMLNWLKLNYLFRKPLEWIHLAYPLVVLLTISLKVLKKKECSWPTWKVICFFAIIFIFSKTLVQCIKCLTLWYLYALNSNTAIALFSRCYQDEMVLSCNKYFPLKCNSLVWLMKCIVPFFDNTRFSSCIGVITGLFLAHERLNTI